ncbi:hypothetical protein C491_01676 [Natronococcus amylolyticus DSM 10524]|uniref:Uncharacterized protein n=1 Tax=Natronococcus amylolyticus DSM 10524 TaxID=1227497 RepID=L9XHR3_9EURY|nr:hypothetical protein [Natronococcus amylolyticus]ELY61142.1 hypothetical protein C491_01676 [Natronococcus amylolyticus DSM 10524]
MTELPWPDEPADKSADEPDERARAIQDLLFAVAFTPLLLFVSPVRDVPSAEAALIAVCSGVVAGVAASLLTDRLALERRDGLATTLAAVVGVVVLATSLWVVVPVAHTPTLLLFVLVILWASALTAATRVFVLPAIADPS